MKRKIILLIVMVCLVCCTKQNENDWLMNAESKLVVSCVITPKADTCHLLLGTTISIGTNIYSEYDSLTFIEAYISSASGDTMFFSPYKDIRNQYYAFSKGFVIEGSIYNLYVNTLEFGVVTSTTNVPQVSQEPIMVSLEESYVEHQFWGELDYGFNASWENYDENYLFEFSLGREKDSMLSVIGYILSYEMNRTETSINIPYSRVFPLRVNNKMIFKDCNLYLLDDFFNLYLNNCDLELFNDGQHLSVINPSGLFLDNGNINGGYGIFGSFVLNQTVIERLKNE